MKLTRHEINAVASAALSGMWPPNAKFYHEFFHIPFGRAMALERHIFGKADIRRVRGALVRAYTTTGTALTTRAINEIREMAFERVASASRKRILSLPPCQPDAG